MTHRTSYPFIVTFNDVDHRVPVVFSVIAAINSVSLFLFSLQVNKRKIAAYPVTIET